MSFKENNEHDYFSDCDVNSIDDLEHRDGVWEIDNENLSLICTRSKLSSNDFNKFRAQKVIDEVLSLFENKFSKSRSGLESKYSYNENVLRLCFEWLQKERGVSTDQVAITKNGNWVKVKGSLKEEDKFYIADYYCDYDSDEVKEIFKSWKKEKVALENKESVSASKKKTHAEQEKILLATLQDYFSVCGIDQESYCIAPCRLDKNKVMLWVGDDTTNVLEGLSANEADFEYLNRYLTNWLADNGSNNARKALGLAPLSEKENMERSLKVLFELNKDKFQNDDCIWTSDGGSKITLGGITIPDCYVGIFPHKIYQQYYLWKGLKLSPEVGKRNLIKQLNDTLKSHINSVVSVGIEDGFYSIYYSVNGKDKILTESESLEVCSLTKEEVLSIYDEWADFSKKNFTRVKHLP